MFPLKSKIAKVPVVPVYLLSTGMIPSFTFVYYSLPIITPPSLPHVTAMLLSCDMP
jgi:hypothetical protein